MCELQVDTDVMDIDSGDVRGDNSLAEEAQVKGFKEQQALVERIRGNALKSLVSCLPESELVQGMKQVFWVFSCMSRNEFLKILLRFLFHSSTRRTVP